MIDTTQANAVLRTRRGLWLGILLLPIGLLIFGLAGTASSSADTLALANGAENGDDEGENANPAKVDPAHVAGAQSCAECHKSEHAAWQNTAHHGSLSKIESGANVADYAEAVGIDPADVLKDSVCVTCHATPQAQGGSVAAVSGVSCESCHGGSVGNSEWLKLHVKPENREAAVKSGMLPADDLYAIARNCFYCHVVTNEELVNEGHPSGNKLELLGWSSGEVRHNFLADQNTNAVVPRVSQGQTAERRRVKYVLGLLVDLELRLANLKKVGKRLGRKSFAKDNARRLKSTTRDLEKVIKALGGNAPNELLKAQQAIDDMGRVSSFSFKSQEEAAEAYPVVKAAAKAFAKNDGSALAAVDEIVEDEASPRGEPFEP